MAENQQTTPPQNAQQDYWNCVCIPLTQGYHTLIDIEDYPSIAAKTWFIATNARTQVYAATYHRKNGKGNTVRLHRYLFNERMDHKDGDTLNNRRSNLRPCTQAMNCCNRRKRYRNQSSKYKGVSRNKRRGKWEASIKANGKNHFLGYYTDETDAAIAYNEAALRYHGEFASLNIIHPEAATSRQTA